MNIFGMVAAAVLFCAAVNLACKLLSEFPLHFDAQIWNGPQKNNERLRMVNDIKSKVMGASKIEVEKLLGEPIKDRGLYPGDYFYYLLGTQVRFGDTDGIWLCLRFKNDRVDAVQMAQD